MYLPIYLPAFSKSEEGRDKELLITLVWLNRTGNTDNSNGAASPPDKRFFTSDPQIVYTGKNDGVGVNIDRWIKMLLGLPLRFEAEYTGYFCSNGK